MGRDYKPVDMPVGAEVAAHRFAAACKRDGLKGPVVLTCSDGAVDCWTFMTSNGPQTNTLIDGGWYAWGGIDE